MFLEDINNELNVVKIKPKYKDYIYNNNKSIKENNLSFKQFFSEYENSIITKIFYLHIITKYTCTCNYIIYNFQKIIDILLLIPNNINEISLKEILNLIFTF